MMQHRLKFHTALCSLILAGSLRAAEPTYEQLQGMYQNTLTQLQAAQDRKNELAKENADLQSRLARSDTDLTNAQASLVATQGELASLREQQTLWTQFLQSSVDLTQQWMRYAQLPAGESTFDVIFHRNWPFSVL